MICPPFKNSLETKKKRKEERINKRLQEAKSPLYIQRFVISAGLFWNEKILGKMIEIK